MRALRPLVALSCCLVGVGLGGCGPVRTAATRSLMREVTAAARGHDDVELVGQALPTYLLLLDGLLEDDPDNAELLRSGAEGYTALGTLVELDDTERAARLYRRARDYGRRALVARRPQVEPLLQGTFPRFLEIDARLHDDDLPYVFWAASAWGAWIGANSSSMAALADLPRVIHLMEWVLARDEGYEGASPHVFLGVYDATLPAMLGGDLEASRRHFERALELTHGQDQMVRVYMARSYARQAFDRELFVSLLGQVMESPVDAVADLALRNAIAQRLARDLLEDVDACF